MSASASVKRCIHPVVPEGIQQSSISSVTFHLGCFIKNRTKVNITFSDPGRQQVAVQSMPRCRHPLVQALDSAQSQPLIWTLSHFERSNTKTSSRKAR